VRALPFADDTFDAIVSVDAFEYFGTDVHLLPSLLRVLKPGGAIAMSTPALRVDPYVGAVPPHVAAVVGREAAAWHAPAWWKRHWELSDLLDDVQAAWQVGGRDDWIAWARAGCEARGERSDAVLEMLERDTGEEIGFALVSARKRG
jgi:SAM-dependent methyltransferase